MKHAARSSLHFVLGELYKLLSSGSKKTKQNKKQHSRLPLQRVPDRLYGMQDLAFFCCDIWDLS